MLGLALYAFTLWIAALWIVALRLVLDSEISFPVEESAALKSYLLCILAMSVYTLYVLLSLRGMVAVFRFSSVVDLSC